MTYLVPGRIFEQELIHLKEAKLKLAPKKCSLFQLEVKLLGHAVSKKGVGTDPDKLHCVGTWS